MKDLELNRLSVSCQCEEEDDNCNTLCEGSCQSSCQRSCQSGCQRSCQSTCERSCQIGCEKLCEVKCQRTCQSTCERSCQSGCERSCQSTCEKSCMDSCETSCMEKCEFSCMTACENSCMTACEKGCMTTCEKGCMTACETSCMDSCETSCMEKCEFSCMTACEKGCMTTCEKGCMTSCETSCMDSCETSCMEKCEFSCMTACENSCMTTCEKGCMTSCMDSCQTSCEATCMDSCQASCEDTCMTSCLTWQTSCEDYCMACSMDSCDTACQKACQSNGETGFPPLPPTSVSHSLSGNVVTISFQKGVGSTKTRVAWQNGSKKGEKVTTGNSASFTLEYGETYGYGVRAENDYGFTKWVTDSFEIPDLACQSNGEAGYKPLAPSIDNITVTKHDATVIFTHGKGATSTKWILYSHDENDGLDKIRQGFENLTSNVIKLSNLESGQNYRLDLFSTNDIGNSSNRLKGFTTESSIIIPSENTVYTKEYAKKLFEESKDYPGEKEYRDNSGNSKVNMITFKQWIHPDNRSKTVTLWKSSSQVCTDGKGNIKSCYHIATTAASSVIKAEEVPYIVMPGGNNNDVYPGDLGIVMDTITGRSTYVIYSEVGPSNKLGEMSIAAFNALGLKCYQKKDNITDCQAFGNINNSTRKDGKGNLINPCTCTHKFFGIGDQRFITIMFPGSRIHFGYDRGAIPTTAEEIRVSTEKYINEYFDNDEINGLPDGWVMPIASGTEAGYVGDTGLDIAAPKGTACYAAADGTILYSEYGHTKWKTPPDTPWSVLIELDNPFEFEGLNIKYIWYTHLSELHYEVADNSSSKKIKVKAGDLIGKSGLGNNNAHLHFGVLSNRDQDENQYLKPDQIRRLLNLQRYQEI